MSNYIFSYKSKPEEYKPRAVEIGKEIRAFYDQGRMDIVGSAFIYSGMVKVLARMNTLCIDYNSILTQPETMAQWLNLRPVVESIALVMENLCPLDAGIVFSEAYLNKSIERWVSDIKNDLNVSIAWIIQYGGDGISRRKNLSPGQTRQITNAVKKHGHAAILSTIFRSCVSWVKLCDKVFLPAYMKYKNGNINTLSAAFSKIARR